MASIGREYSVGAGSNPQDIAAVSSYRAYVARLNAADLADRAPDDRRQARQRWTLAPYADADGLPEVTWLAARGGEVYALLARLDGFRPTDFSTLSSSTAPRARWRRRSASPGPIRRPAPYSESLSRFVLIETGGFRQPGRRERSRRPHRVLRPLGARW